MTGTITLTEDEILAVEAGLQSPWIAPYWTVDASSQSSIEAGLGRGVRSLLARGLITSDDLPADLRAAPELSAVRTALSAEVSGLLSVENRELGEDSRRPLLAFAMIDAFAVLTVIDPSGLATFAGTSLSDAVSAITASLRANLSADLDPRVDVVLSRSRDDARIVRANLGGIVGVIDNHEVVPLVVEQALEWLIQSSDG